MAYKQYKLSYKPMAKAVGKGKFQPPEVSQNWLSGFKLFN